MDRSIVSNGELSLSGKNKKTSKQTLKNIIFE